MKNILIGCPYTGLTNIKKAIEESSNENIRIIVTDQITRFSHKGLYLSNEFLPINDIHSSFVRYPFDLSPLHSSTFVDREEIEFYKSIALLVDSIGINSLKDTWALRNRAYSLSQIELFGAEVPDYWLSNTPNTKFIENDWMIKAIGNCYVSEKKRQLTRAQAKFINMEKDEGKLVAFLFASKLSPKEISKYAKAFSSYFTQRAVPNKHEYRCYYVSGQHFIYKKSASQDFDKSIAGYEATSFTLDEKTRVAIEKLAENHNLKYLCLDVIADFNDKNHVIDINPYGTFPAYDYFPQPSKAIAKLLMS